MGKFKLPAFITRNIIISSIIGLIIGVAVILAMIEFDHYTSTDTFCASCHSMDIVAKEYRESIHYTSRSGVRAQCGDCHVHEGVFAAAWDHFMGYNDLLEQLFGPDYDDPVVLNVHRPDMAFRARDWFNKDGSKTCLRCHVREAITGSHPLTHEIHMVDAKDKGCVECHYNLVHRKVPHKKTFKRDKWNEMIEKEYNLKPGDAQKILDESH
jgi:nitrate/TMAO reductase-like tetraheme cytochrome c subunit